jgi:GTP-binding protein
MTGRSNVGKSTLINALLRRQVARTSGPGRWSLYLVDLPGYGYARGGPDAGEELAAVAETYLGAAEPVTLLLVDSRHPGLDADAKAHEWLTSLGVEPVVVATKIDKLSRAERTRNLRELEKAFGKPALPVSAERGEGMDELWKTIASRIRPGKARAADA